ncbi:MAG: lysophospholipid acyltransferase family protein [Salaquimonas sp.]
MNTRSDRQEFAYPRRVILRRFLRFAAGIAFKLLARVEIKGLENLPKSGPVILAGNHFHFSDPVALLCLSKRQVEFVGGFRFPNAPTIVKFLPTLWGYFPVHRGAYSRSSLDYSTATLAKGGVVGIFPEGGAWAEVLRYPRSGIGFLAAESGAVIVPVGLSGFTGLFKIWRPKINMTVGKPIGPFQVDGKAMERKEALADIGKETMQGIAKLLPPHERGVYAEDKKTRDAAKEVAAYPFDQKHMRGM